VVLDVFAGSGALGLEALSRGAGAVTFIEKDRRAAQVLRSTLERLGGGRTTLLERDALIMLAKSPFPQPFDLVFIDPPFATSLAQEALTALVARALLAPGAKVYVEVPQGAELSLADGFEALRQTQAGESVAQLWQWTPPSPVPEAAETRL
jgi:16S rRNA (guanine966-N2)-methyltransferase